MNKYLVYFKTTFKDSLQYRANFTLSMTLDVIWFLVFFALWTSIYSTNNLSSIQGYDLSNLITYYFITEIAFKLGVQESIYMNWQIWNGYFTNDLVKPWNISFVNAIDAISERAVAIIASVPVITLMFLVARNYLQFYGFTRLLLVIITVFLSFLMLIAFNLCIHALAFKYGDQENNLELLNYIGWFLGGAFFPLDFLPQTAQFIFNLFPFRFVSYVPANIYLGKIEFSALPMIWLQIIAWMIFFSWLHRRIYNKGIIHYTGTGQ